MSAARPPRRSVDRTLAQYLRREVYPFADGPRQRLDEARIGSTGLRTLEDLRRVPTMTLEDAADGSTFLLRPSRDALLRAGTARSATRVAWASTWGRWSTYIQRSIEPRYRPVHYFDADGVPVGATIRDLVRLSALGGRWLHALGITKADTLVVVGGARGGVEPWELSAATRRLAVPLGFVDDAARAANLAPSVVAGEADSLTEALRDGAWPGLRLALVFGRSVGGVIVAPGVPLLRAWAPPGTRAAWFECGLGAAGGWHTNPDAEIVETDEAGDGEVVWTALGWSGTVFLRLRTDVRARIERHACPGCGWVGPRLIELDGRPSLGRFLAADPRVTAYRLTAEGADVLPARAGANARLKADSAAAAPGAVLRIVGKRAWNKEQQ